MRAGACLQLREQVADVALDRLLAEEEPDADLAVHETVGNELQHLDLARGRLLAELLNRGLERDHLGDGVTARGNRLEPSRVLAVPRQNLVALGSVHERTIGSYGLCFRSRYLERVNA